MDKGVASVLFSATFLPIQYYKNLLGGEDCDYEVYAKSTFSPERQIQLIGREVTSKYTRRNEAEYENIARYIHAVIDAKEGNYMVFLPSFDYLYKVYSRYIELYGEKGTIIQEENLSEIKKEEFLKSFNEDSNIIGFTVVGGMFSEGVDLPGDKLIGAIIVGVGFPMVSIENNIIAKP